ncbi:MAG: FAD-dependent oxidoreductase [Sutterella sp.]
MGIVLLVLGGGPVGVEMAQAIHRMGASVALVEGMDHVLPREPKPLGDALGSALRADGVELHFGEHAAAVSRDGDDYVLEFDGRPELRGDRPQTGDGRLPSFGTDVAVGIVHLPFGGIERDFRHQLPQSARRKTKT